MFFWAKIHAAPDATLREFLRGLQLVGVPVRCVEICPCENGDFTRGLSPEDGCGGFVRKAQHGWCS